VRSDEILVGKDVVMSILAEPELPFYARNLLLFSSRLKRRRTFDELAI
jgi:hypothetical protein